MELLGFVIGKRRKFATFTPTVVVTEIVDESSDITTHPIDQGSLIADHVIQNPPIVTMDVYFNPNALIDFAKSSFKSETFSPRALGDAAKDSFFGEAAAKLYSEILEIRDSAIPFDVITGKRAFKDMLFKSIRYSADNRTENVLHLMLEFQHVTLVPLVTVQLKPKTQDAKTKDNGTGLPQGTSNAQAVADTANQNESFGHAFTHGLIGESK